MEIAQDALNQLMGFIFIVALIYLGIAFSLEFMRGRTEIIHLSDRSKYPKSYMQSQPIQASRLNSMEPILDWFEHLSPPPIFDQSVSSKEETGDKCPTNDLAEPVATELEDLFAIQAAIGPASHSTAQATEQAAAAPSFPLDAKEDEDVRADLDNAYATIGESIVIAEETSEALAAELEDFFTTQAEMTSADESDESSAEVVISSVAPDSEAGWGTSEGLEVVDAQPMEFQTITVIPEDPSIDQREPYFNDEEVEYDYAVSSEAMPPEFEDVWARLGETQILSEETEPFAALERLLTPETEAEPLNQETPISTSDLEELTAVDLDELFPFPADVPPLRQHEPKLIEEPDGPTDEELEEIFGAQLKFECQWHIT